VCVSVALCYQVGESPGSVRFARPKISPGKVWPVAMQSASSDEDDEVPTCE